MKLPLQPVILIVVCTMLWGRPEAGYSQTQTYKSARPVIDVIERERPVVRDEQTMRDLESQSEFYSRLLSREFLAALLSFLILFQTVYIYFRYIRTSKKVIDYPHRRARKTVKKKKKKHKIKTVKKPLPEEKKEPLPEESPEETTSFDNEVGNDDLAEDNPDDGVGKPDIIEIEELKTMRETHAQRIYHLLEKL